MNIDSVIQQYLIETGSGLTVEVIKAGLGRVFSRGGATKTALKKELNNVARVHGTTIHADNLINAMARNGFLQITDSNFYAANSVRFGGENDGFSLHNVDSRTNHTVVHTGPHGFVQGGPGSSIVQGPPGRPGDVEITSRGEIWF